jgi:hypothetical protein
MRLHGILPLVLALSSAPAAPENLLRNGSFEGSLLYWHGIDPGKHKLVREGARVGAFALRIEKGYVMSAPFVARRNENVTVSFWARGDRNGEVHVQMPPSAREEGQRAKRLWTREATKVARVTPEWQRVSFTWPADVPPSGFWPDPHYMVLIGSNDSTPLLVDGVAVTPGDQGTADYVPRREVEIVAECPDLPGWEGPKGNFLERGATVRLTAHASNPGPQPRDVTLRWQFIDYEGVKPLGAPAEKKVSLPAGGTASETLPLALPAAGMVLARLSVHSGTTVVDSSDLPLTSLPYPKAAVKPDWRERFGGSFAGGTGCTQKFQRLGFGWIRWRPHMNGEDHLPRDPKGGEWEWRWFDKELDEQEAHGCSTHGVLYPPPKWIMEKGHPLPKDMRWPADDPRWDDLSVETTWDRFVRGAVTHYRGRSLIYEIENEPEFDPWDEKKLFPEYARFTIRTARLIKQADPKAKVMVNNVYGIPSGVNAAFFRAGGLKFIDVVSWHDYHAGWLTDAPAIRRMRQNMDEAGGKHAEIWFNEGWAFTNTAVDEPPACTGLTSAQSCNAIVDSVAELTVNGQEKTILFHTAYERHGMSFWDYSGPGTMLWDWYNYPLPIAAAWNVLNHHIGVSDEVGFVRPPGGNFCVFQDLRNGRGVMIAYADRDAKADATVALPDFGAPLSAEDIMGNASEAPKTLVLSKTGRPVLLYSAANTAGKAFLEKLQPLDRKHQGFVSAGGAAWSLPPSWEGKEKGSSEGSVALAGGRPVWRLEQLWPPDWTKKENFRPMTWTGTDWNVKEGGFGGQPGAALKDSALVFGTRAPHGQPPQGRVCGLTFVAPREGTYALSGTAECRIWDGKQKTVLRLLHKKASEVKEAGNVAIPHGGQAPLDSLSVTLAAGEEFTLLPQIEGMYAGGHCTLKDFKVTLGGAVYRLPASWEGVKKGSVEGNPVRAGGKPVWRIDRVYPDKVIMAENYAAVPWDGTAWHPLDREQGGQPGVRVENGTARLSVSGPWQGIEFQKIAGVVFIVPEGGVWRVRASAGTKPWSGDAKTYRLSVLKKDTQRAAEVKSFDLPRDGSPVALDFEVELTVGHELVFLPLMPDWNNATTTTLEGLSLERVR